jgi:SAM-dependent methyltransferase
MAPDAGTTWGLGDYALMARRLEPVADRVVDLAAMAPCAAVLDVACGTGNAALAAARRGARVTGADTEPRLLDLARERARAEGLEVAWCAGDAAALPLPDDTFDAVLTVFGAMYAPDHEAAAAELARVAAPGGRVVSAAWVPGGLLPAMGGRLAPFLPVPPAGSGPPAQWGDEAAATALLAAAGVEVSDARHERLVARFADREAAVDMLVRSAGHLFAERAALEAEGRWADALAALAALVDERDAGAGAEVVLELEHLIIVGGAGRGP